MDSQLTLASDASLIKRLQRIPDLLTMRLSRTEERRKAFFRKFGNVENFVAGRVIDLTAAIKIEVWRFKFLHAVAQILNYSAVDVKTSSM